jgi:hypothetical protein
MSKNSADLSEVLAAAKKRTEEVEERKELQQQARRIKLRTQELKAKQEAQEKLVAPLLLLATIVVSAIVMFVAHLRQ